MDKQLEWCRANLRGFKEMNDAVLAVKAEEAENRRVMGPAMEAHLKNKHLVACGGTGGTGAGVEGPLAPLFGAVYKCNPLGTTLA